MAEIKLNDLLKLTDEEIARVRIRLNRDNGVTDPIDEFKKNPQTLLTWNYWNNHSFKENQISIGFVNMGNDRWLLFTVGVIKKVVDKPKDFKGVQVEYCTLKKYEPLYGRVVVKYHNTVQQMIRKGELLDELVVSEILPSVFTGFDFPGYDKVCLSYSELENIVNGNYPSYQNALKNQKAVYVQTDKHTGKLYVGSATAEKGMLLARWKNYVDNGHGGNVGLKELIDKEGFEYIKNNFQYTIIENFNSKVDDKYVLERESYWKTVLQTREFGYNKN
jgi:hypothetical protein